MATASEAINQYVTRQKEFNARQGVAIDGIVSDLTSLNDKILELQNSPGAITPEDQAKLDELQQQGEAMAQRAEALDQQTPPVAPPVPA